MTLSHGRVGKFSIDNPAGSLVTVEHLLTSAQYSPSSDRPNTETFGQRAERNQVLGLREATYSIEGFFSASTAKVHGRSLKVLLGAYNATGYFDSLSVARNVDLPETQTFGDGFKERGVPGLRHDSMSLGGPHDRDSNASYDLLRAALAASTGSVLSVGHNGFAIGSLVELLSGMCTQNQLPMGVNDVNKISAEFKADGGVDLGVSLHDLTAETADVNSTSVDDTASTANGGWAHLNVTATAGAGTATIKVQHSANDTDWADLVTFTGVTGVTSERVEVVEGTTVNQYLRASLVNVGSTNELTSITYVVAFARRDYVSASTAGSYRHWASLAQHANSQTVSHGPDGSTAGLPKITGEFRLSALTANFGINDVQTFSATLMNDGTVTETTW